MKKTPQRKCVGCREMRDKSTLLRVCLAPNGQGRGAYICKNRVCIEQARKQKGLERSFRKAVPPDVYSQLINEV
ncbi:MAG: YlxR family protein [Defluviitaleaceae bacterium]|nr:YlxR family protein [Defluviitaleaceae bacterium]MCL2240214.1 YlxR family protein [Defluviitaleaceae bacterium]